MKTNRIIAVHLLNDFSGSPFVLRQSLEALVKKGYTTELYTATPGKKGFLTGINGVTENRIFYRWSTSKWLTMLLFLYSQASLFLLLLIRLKKTDVVYINSILPFSAAIAGRIRGCKVLYHVHEVSIKPAMLKKFLLAVANSCSNAGIFVSKDVLKRTGYHKESAVVYNALPANFIQEAVKHTTRKEGPFTILMLCSLKKYKGVMEFVACAGRLPQFRFMLVLNASQCQIDVFFKNETLPANLELYPAQENVHPFYQQADVVMNLSLPDQWVETFGMTILEAMYYKKPVIIPAVGGITELVTDGEEGYRVNPGDTSKICSLLLLMAACPSLYLRLSLNAFKKAQQFTPACFTREIINKVASLSTISLSSKEPMGLQLPLF